MRSTQQNDERPGDINPASSATYAEHSRCSPRCDACSSSPSFSSRARLICSEVPPRSLSRKELLRDAGVEEAPPHRLVEALRPLRAAVRLPAARAPHAEPRKDKVDPPAEDWAMDPAHRTAQHIDAPRGLLQRRRQARHALFPGNRTLSSVPTQRQRPFDSIRMIGSP